MLCTIDLRTWIRLEILIWQVEFSALEKFTFLKNGKISYFNAPLRCSIMLFFCMKWHYWNLPKIPNCVQPLHTPKPYRRPNEMWEWILGRRCQRHPNSFEHEIGTYMDPVPGISWCHDIAVLGRLTCNWFPSLQQSPSHCTVVWCGLLASWVWIARVAFRLVWTLPRRTFRGNSCGWTYRSRSTSLGDLGSWWSLQCVGLYPGKCTIL